MKEITKKEQELLWECSNSVSKMHTEAMEKIESIKSTKDFLLILDRLRWAYEYLEDIVRSENERN